MVMVCGGIHLKSTTAPYQKLLDTKSISLVQNNTMSKCPFSIENETKDPLRLNCAPINSKEIGHLVKWSKATLRVLFIECYVSLRGLAEIYRSVL